MLKLVLMALCLALPMVLMALCLALLMVLMAHRLMFLGRWLLMVHGAAPSTIQFA